MLNLSDQSVHYMSLSANIKATAHFKVNKSKYLIKRRVGENFGVGK